MIQFNKNILKTSNRSCRAVPNCISPACKKPARILAVVAAFAVTAGCGAKSEPQNAAIPSASASLPAVPRSTSTSSKDGQGPIRMVIQAGTDWVTAELAIKRRASAIQNSCMRGAGFAYVEPQPDREQIILDGYASGFGTEIAYQPFRTKEGYGITGGLVGLRPPGESGSGLSVYLAKLNATEKDAFQKKLSDCEQRARKEGLPADALDELDEKTKDLNGQIATDRRATEAQKAWSTCMAASGYHFTQPQQPPISLEAKARPLYESPSGVGSAQAKALHAEELRTAASDWACQEKTVVPARFAVRDELETRFIEANPELIARVRSAMQKVIES
jgi:hypothetical protein